MQMTQARSVNMNSMYIVGRVALYIVKVKEEDDTLWTPLQIVVDLLFATVSSARKRKVWGTRAGISEITWFFIFYGKRFKAGPGTNSLAI